MFAAGNVWIEATMLPFLMVLVIFLAGRFGVKAEINRRFFLLVLSTFAAAALDVVHGLFPDVLPDRTFYVFVNINAYSLMCYIAAYVRRSSKNFLFINGLFLFLSILTLFMFHSDEPLYKTLCSAFAVLFVAEGFCLQLIYQQYYGNGQFIVMNFLLLLLIDAFVIQYVFNQSFPVYATSTFFLFFTFFYLEAPAYRQIITSQKETENARLEAEASIRKANAANKAKSNFLANTSHEIRTPMNAILGMNEMILQESKDKETQKASLDIKRAGEHLLNIVNNILDISKIDAGKMDLFEADYHLWKIIKECESYVLKKINRKNIRFLLEVDKSMPEYLYGDSERLKQVLINLLDNAVKYTAQGHITMSISHERKSKAGLRLMFTIKDTGIGIKESDVPKIFEPFERVNLIETRHILGAGLGLTLVKNIASIMGGKVKVQSVYGEGSSFSFEVPQQLAHGDEISIQDYESTYSAEIKENKKLENENEPVNFQNAKILIVDDTPVNLVVAKGMLKNSGADINTAESGEDALDMIKKTHYDIVFLDHKMPGMDGPETLKHAKKYAKDTAFVALTANTGANARAEYIALGFDDFLPKPFKTEQINKILKAYLHRLTNK